jgi:hypothetical protein
VATAALLRDPRAVKLSNQLRGQAAALAARNITTIPPAYIDEVADQMIALGWIDLAGIDAVQETVTGYATVQRGDEYGPELVEFSRHVWSYNGAPMYAMESPDVGFDKLLPVANTADGQFTAWMEWIDPPGVPIVILRRRKQASLNFMRGITFVGGFLAVAAGLPGIIGNAVLGAELAASYPALSTAIGQVATRTVLTGGDVEKAVSGAAASLVGAEFGGFVGEAVDSAAIGAGTAAATTAALQGGDPRRAVLQSVATSGVFSEIVSRGGPDMSDYDPNEYIYEPSTMVDDFGQTNIVLPGEITLDDLGLDFNLDDVLSNLENPEALTVPLDAVLPDDAGNLFAVDGHYIELQPEQYLASLYPDEAGNIRTPDNQILMPANEVLKYLEFEGGTVQLAADLRARIEPLQGDISIPAAAPALRPGAIPPPAGQTKTPVFDWAKQADALLKTAVSIGASIKAIATGNYRPGYPTSPFGTARPPVGVPVRQPDGSTVVNNGNGTQTIRFPDGRVQTMPTTYTSTGLAGNYGGSLVPGISNQTLLIGGAVLVAAVLLARR